jgi:hypothetical protein
MKGKRRDEKEKDFGKDKGGRMKDKGAVGRGS